MAKPHTASKLQNTIKQVANLLPGSLLRNFALVHPHLNYGILSWGWSTPSQNYYPPKREIRTINKATYNSHTDPLFRSSQVLKVQDLYIYQSALSMFDYVQNNLPVSFNHIFPFNRDIQTIRQTRQSDLLYVSRCTSSFASKLPLHTLPKLWNQWANCASLSRYQFKQHLKSSTILSYQSQVKCSYAYCKNCR